MVLDLTAGICKDCMMDMLSVIKEILELAQELRIVSAIDDARISAWDIVVVLEEDTDWFNKYTCTNTKFICWTISVGTDAIAFQA